LENRSINGTTALDLFLPKCKDNEILRGDLKRAVAIPSKSILFNIDQKAEIISKTQVDALLSVFVKVFDEMSGYYGKQAYIAKFERDLDGRGQYVPFRDAYQNVSGQSWERGREVALLEAKNIAQAYALATGAEVTAAQGILDRYRSDYKLSIEDFANQINGYIEQQKPNFRLNFFVDEVGQYIADNTKLMTNLQTVAESLETKCRGRAWIIVTAQEDMNAVVGEMNKQQGNDFSKIQARFANRMKLTSANVDEVIQKRLLLKNESGVALLTDIYHEQTNNSGPCSTLPMAPRRIAISKIATTSSMPIPSSRISLPSFRRPSRLCPSIMPLKGSTAPSGNDRCLGCFNRSPCISPGTRYENWPPSI